MRSLIITITIAVLAVTSTRAQNNVGINNATPHASAALMVDTSTSGPQGILIPRMTQGRRNAIAGPATGLMIFQTDNTPGFYFYNGTAWSAVGGGMNSGVKLELVATKIAATQTPASAQGSNTGDVIVFDNVVTVPTLGSYSTASNSYTVGQGQSGLYQIQVRSVSIDNATPSNTTGHWFKIEILPSGGSASLINATDIYGPYPPVSNANFPSGLKGRSEISALVYLNAGDSFVIKGLSANSSVTNAIKNDGSCKLTVVKLN